jgi:ketosteroid isomerase-like protein
MASAALLAGCLGGGGASDPAQGAITATIHRLERATARGDFAAVCADLLTPSARRRAGGPDCPRLTGTAAAGVKRPRIEVEQVDRDGDVARVTVVTRASGQPDLEERLVLRRVKGRWRIDSLGG